MNLPLFLLRIFQGALIGGGAILPGVSGGVLAVIFGVYRPMMALFSSPFKALKEYWKLFLPIGIGAALGFVYLAKLMGLLFSGEDAYAVSLFVGLIAGTVPALFDDADSQGKAKGSFWALAGCFVLLAGPMLLLKLLPQFSISPNGWWCLFCGVLWGFSLIVPGASSSSILIYLGLYQSMSAGIGALDFGVILPLFAGILLTALLFSRAVKKLFEKRFTLASYGVIGLVLASTVLIVPTSFRSLSSFFICLLCAAAGFAGALLLDWLGKKLTKGKE